jgi:cyanophycinase-like exopeptidase
VVWRAIVEAWQAGAAVAGCSAGAAALSAVAGNVRDPGRGEGRGLGLVPHVGVIPHFDRIEAWRPGLTTRILASAPREATVVGIDEDTALVGGPERWTVQGERTVTVFARVPRNHERAIHRRGDELRLLPPAGG